MRRVILHVRSIRPVTNTAAGSPAGTPRALLLDFALQHIRQRNPKTDRVLLGVVVDQRLAVSAERLHIAAHAALQGEVPVQLQRALAAAGSVAALGGEGVGAVGVTGADVAVSIGISNALGKAWV